MYIWLTLQQLEKKKTTAIYQNIIILLIQTLNQNKIKTIQNNYY